MNQIKKQNLEKLEEWKENSLKKKLLTLEEAKKLYIHFKQTKDKSLREDLILGTLPLVHQNIAGSSLVYVCYQEFDILDVLQEAVELWIRIVDEGELLKRDYYSNFFQSHGFFTQIARNYLNLAPIIPRVR